MVGAVDADMNSQRKVHPTGPFDHRLPPDTYHAQADYMSRERFYPYIQMHTCLLVDHSTISGR